MSGRDQSRTYSRKDSVVFLKTDAPFGGLSNMAGGYPIHVNGVRILTSEALYQACRFPHLPDVQKLIISQISPMTAKMRSKPYRKDSRADGGWRVQAVVTNIGTGTVDVEIAATAGGEPFDDDGAARAEYQDARAVAALAAGASVTVTIDCPFDPETVLVDPDAHVLLGIQHHFA